MQLGRKLAREILADPKKVALLMAKAKALSPIANRKAPVEWEAILLRLISSAKSVTHEDLQVNLKNIGETVLGIDRLSVLLGKLASKGLVVIEKTGTSIYARKKTRIKATQQQ